MDDFLKIISWEESALKCGTKILYLPKKELPLSTILVLIKAGSSLDPKGKEGLARLVFKSMITETKNRDLRTLPFEIESIGASLDVYTSRDFTILNMELLSKNLIKGIEILSDIILNPVFKEEDIEKEKEKAINIIKDERDDPALVATRSFIELIFKNTSYAHPSIGYTSTIENLNRDDITRFYKERVKPENSFIVLVGDFDKDFFKALEEFLIPWESSPSKYSEPEIKISEGGEFLILNDPDSTQTQIRIGKSSSLKRGERDFIAATLGNAILGNLFTSRLISKIRGELGLSYAINSSIQSFKYGGLFFISTFTKNESVFEIIDAVKKEVENFVENGIKEEELQRVKNFVKGKFPSSLQTNSELAGKIAEIEFYNLSRTYFNDFLKTVEEISKKEVEEASKKYLSSENFSILLVGKEEEIGKKLSLIGKFNVKELKNV